MTVHDHSYPAGVSETPSERYGVADDETDIERGRLAGCDMVFCLFNPYKVPHDKVMQTIELMGAEVILQFA